MTIGKLTCTVQIDRETLPYKSQRLIQLCRPLFLHIAADPSLVNAAIELSSYWNANKPMRTVPQAATARGWKIQPQSEHSVPSWLGGHCNR